MANVARRGNELDCWHVVRRCQELVAVRDPASAIAAELAEARIANRTLRERIRRGIAAHVARGDRENLAANLQLALPSRIAQRRWSRYLPSVLVAIATVWSRSWFVGASVFGWLVIAAIVIGVVRRRRIEATVAAVHELDRIRIMVAHRDVEPALRRWRKLRARGPISEPVADAIADGACAIEQLALDALSIEQRRELAAELVDLVPYVSRDCAFDATLSIRRLG